ncbi:Gfo/Idh/MocA family protein [Hellea balneolensis]|uniref:Gfo/Idh/MocA family protein n=1 Tax=Hellea balneolensis TaxID=287478 RepID=UPI001F491085|nr:Gfo/Idh/MocA family oxidoreductase [Hellea balneolensis]
MKVAVIGAGVFGGYHANKCAENSHAEFIGIFDPDIGRAKSQAAKHGVQAFDNYKAMLDKCEAVVVASPADTHGTMAITALEFGKHCLIEKPVASKLKDAARIVELATEKDLFVQVGHQERFVAKAIGLNTLPENPTRIMSRRMSKYSERGTDVSVSLDLMTHDLDLVVMLMGGLPQQVKGQTRIEKSQFPDFSQGELKYAQGSALLTASRLEDDFSRTMDITYPSGEVHIDFNAKTLSHTTPFDLNAEFGSDPSAKDSLGAASEAFISAILDGTPVPVTAQDGYNALKLALAIDGEISWENDV